MNEQLKKLLEEDQYDLRTLPFNRVERDRERRNKVKAIVESGGAKVGIDYIHAAVIFQHGESLEDWWKAYQFSLKGVELGFRQKWLAAVAMDRWLVRQGKPLKYGNQVIPFGGIYRIPKINPNTTDAEREEWDIPSLADLFSFRNLPGFMEYEIVDTLEISNLKVKIIRLERHPVHSPFPTGSLCGKTEDYLTIYENTYGWRWVEKEDGSFIIGWLLMPDVPEIAHAIAGEGITTIEELVINEESCIQVNDQESKTIYFRGNKGIWAVTGVDFNTVYEKVNSIQAKVY